MNGVLGSIAQGKKFIVNHQVFQGEKRNPLLSFFICARGVGGWDYSIVYGTWDLNCGRPAQPHLRPHAMVLITGFERSHENYVKKI